MITLPLEMTRGDTFQRTLTFTDSNDDAIDISGWTIFFTVKKTEYDSLDDSDAVIKTTDIIGVGTSGKAVITVAAADTINIDPDIYKYDVQIKKGDGTIYTAFRGNFTILSDTTRRIT